MQGCLQRTHPPAHPPIRPPADPPNPQPTPGGSRPRTGSWLGPGPRGQGCGDGEGAWQCGARVSMAPLVSHTGERADSSTLAVAPLYCPPGWLPKAQHGALALPGHSLSRDVGGEQGVPQLPLPLNDLPQVLKQRSLKQRCQGGLVQGGHPARDL